MTPITSLSSIVVFILATARQLQNYSSFDTRMIPTSQTWGSLFENLYFIYGNDPYDHQVLKDRCTFLSKSSIEIKSSYSSQATLIEESVELHSCSYPKNNSYIHDKGVLKILRFPSCPGTYYGKGPTCRCQSSLLWYSKSELIKQTSWVIFIDDDIFMRPHAVATLIHSFETNILPTYFTLLRPVVLMADVGKSRNGNGIELSKKWNRTLYDCGQHYLPVLMPLLINVDGIHKIRPALEVNAMIELQRLWGGTHDMIIGMLVSMIGIPTYSFHKQYTNVLYSREDGINISSSVVMVHKVKNMKKPHRIRVTSVIDQYDVTNYFGDCYSIFSRKRCGDLSISDFYSLENVKYQVQAGITAYRYLEQVPNTLSMSLYRNKREIYEYTGIYQPFLFEDCKLK